MSLNTIDPTLLAHPSHVRSWLSGDLTAEELAVVIAGECCELGQALAEELDELAAQLERALLQPGVRSALADLLTS